jgi:TPR repeat protein
MLLEARGELSAAEAAYRRADQRGDAAGALNLGGMLAERHDFARAEAAYRRAAERGDLEVADMANAALSHLRQAA